MQISSYTFKLVFIVISFLIGQASFVMAKTVIVDGIYLIVNSEMATRSQAKTVSAALKAQPQPTEGEQISHEEQLLMRMVQEMLLLDRAKALKIEPSEKEIESRLNQITRSQPKILEVYFEEDLQN